MQYESEVTARAQHEGPLNLDSFHFVVMMQEEDAN